jgi:hypothetical protein
MKFLIKSIFFTIFILFVQNLILHAQNDLEAKPPTLQIGLDGFSLDKGSLDAQLIMEIIAEKQQELKIKAIQNVFLKKVANAGGTVYSFTDNVVRELVFEKDPKVRTTKILENTVNIVFVSSFLKHFLSTRDSGQIQQINSLFNKINNSENQISLKTDSELEISSFVAKERESITSYFKDENAMYFITLLLDMCSDAVRKDEKLKQLGLMQISYSATYDYLNKFNQLNSEPIYIKKNEKNIFNKNHFLRIYNDDLDDKDILEISKAVKNIYDEITASLGDITNYIGLVKFIMEEYSFRNENLELFVRHGASISNFKDKVGELTSLKANIETIVNSIRVDNTDDTVLISEINNLNRIYFYIEKAIEFIEKDNANHKIIADIIYTFYSEFRPLLLNQSYRSSEYLKVISQLNEITHSFADLLRAKNNSLSPENFKMSSFLLLASKLYQFNRSTTISEYLKLIEDISQIFPEDNVKNALSTVITFVKDYTVIEKDGKGNEFINFNVESFIVKLHNVKPYKLSRWQFHFTVGMNNAYFDKDLVLSDGSVVRNLSYVGEKIGVKYKLFDRSFWKTRNPGETYQINNKSYIKTAPPKEPLVSNCHAILYGSGLLYNLVNTQSNNEFDMPLIGTGFGVTFYNSLDLNITYGIPIFSNKGLNKSFDNSFVNIGFDIQFIEYYKRLQSKRKANRTQKKLSQVSN